jgi:hypothetical protein
VSTGNRFLGCNLCYFSIHLFCFIICFIFLCMPFFIGFLCLVNLVVKQPRIYSLLYIINAFVFLRREIKKNKEEETNIFFMNVTRFANSPNVMPCKYDVSMKKKKDSYHGFVSHTRKVNTYECL